MISRPIGGVASLKGDPITIGLAIELKQLLFGNANRDFPPGWKNQAFEFNDRDMLKFGLIQHRGGPCGILASVQAFILRFLIFKDDQERWIEKNVPRVFFVLCICSIIIECCSRQSCEMFFKWAIHVLNFVYVRSFQTTLQNKNCRLIRIQTLIGRVGCKHADHLTPNHGTCN